MDNKCYLWFTSSGEAAKRQSKRIGEYKRAGTWEDRSYWKRTDREDETQYLYWNDAYWLVGNVLGENRGGIAHYGYEKDPPQTGWEYFDDGWKSDQRLTLKASAGFCGSDRGRDEKAKDLGHPRWQIDQRCKEDPHAQCFAKVFFVIPNTMIIINIYRDQM